MVEIVLHALVEPRRRDILELVRDHELTAGDIAMHFDVTRPAISQHLKVLDKAGLVTVRREGTKRLYKVRPEGFIELRDYIASYWDLYLQKLKHVAEQAEHHHIDDDRESS